MRRADRLFQIVQSLRRRRVTTARQLALELEVSERTIYRDIADLLGSGVPIEGEAGVGYRLPRHFDLPPLMFTADEIEALVLGGRIIQSFADPALAEAAVRALRKIEAVLPPRLLPLVDDPSVFSVNFRPSPAVMNHLAALRLAVRERRKVCIRYTREDGADSERVARPLGLSFIGTAWLLTAWCEERGAFRNFRLDRIQALTVLDEGFVDEPGRRLEDFFVLVGAQG